MLYRSLALVHKLSSSILGFLQQPIVPLQRRYRRNSAWSFGIASSSLSYIHVMPYTESWLALEEQLGGRSALNGTPEELRQGWAELAKVILPLWPEPSKNVSVEDGFLNGVPCRIYTPTGVQPQAVGLWSKCNNYVLSEVKCDAETAST